MSVLECSLQISFAFLALAMFFSLLRLFQGPKLADRVVAIDLFGVCIFSALALYSIQSGSSYFLDVSMVLALFLFLGTSVFARFIESNSRGEKTAENRKEESK